QPKNYLQLYTCSFDFKIKLWDYIDNILINTHIGHKFHAFFTDPNRANKGFIWISMYFLAIMEQQQEMEIQLELHMKTGTHNKKTQHKKITKTTSLLQLVKLSLQNNCELDPNSENVATISWSSKDSNLFVLKPSEQRPFCIQKDISKEEVYRGWGGKAEVFDPGEISESLTSEVHQRRDQFYLQFCLQNLQGLLIFRPKSPEENLD
ncbi:hypothetical protein E2I00_016763, partial [Balaenoptera physalus]